MCSEARNAHTHASSSIQILKKWKTEGDREREVEKERKRKSEAVREKEKGEGHDDAIGKNGTATTTTIPPLRNTKQIKSRLSFQVFQVNSSNCCFNYICQDKVGKVITKHTQLSSYMYTHIYTHILWIYIFLFYVATVAWNLVCVCVCGVSLCVWI